MVQESLKVIEDEADHLAAMVDDLLGATKMQSGELVLKKSEVDIRGLLDVQLRRFKPQTENHELKMQFPDEFPCILADEEGINRLFTNLISNALKYSDGGEILISGEDLGQEVRLCFSDHGEGFDPNDIHYVFERFYRSDRDAKVKKGTGLGLYLCKSIVRAHGGRIWIDEDYHDGARVCFTLPVGE